MVHLLDDGLVAVNETLNHLHVLDVGPMEEVDNVANEKRYHAHQYVSEGIIQDGQCKRNALDDSRREIDERDDAEQGNGITPTRNDANECIEIVSIHVARQPVHRLIGPVVHQSLTPQFFAVQSGRAERTLFVFVHYLMFQSHNFCRTGQCTLAALQAVRMQIADGLAARVVRCELHRTDARALLALHLTGT